MRLVLSRVEPSDFSAIAPSSFNALVHDGGFTAMLGVNNDENIAHAKSEFRKEFSSDASNAWIKITDEDDGGKFVAASNWKIYPTYVEKEVDARAKEFEEFRAEIVTWFKEEKEKEDAASIMRSFFERRYKYMREGHVRTSIGTRVSCLEYFRNGDCRSAPRSDYSIPWD